MDIKVLWIWSPRKTQLKDFCATHRAKAASSYIKKSREGSLHALESFPLPQWKSAPMQPGLSRPCWDCLDWKRLYSSNPGQAQWAAMAKNKSSFDIALTRAMSLPTVGPS